MPRKDDPAGENTTPVQYPLTPKQEPIEELARRHQVEPWIMSGLMVAYNWGAGKELTEREFLKAKNDWLSGPMLRGVE